MCVVLLVYFFFYSNYKKLYASAPILIAIALFFSFIADIVLVQENDVTIAVGICCFFIAYSCYCMLLLQLNNYRFSFNKSSIGFFLFLIPLVLYSIYNIWPALNFFKAPIAVYSVVLVALLVLSISLFTIVNVRPSQAFLLTIATVLIAVCNLSFALHKFLLLSTAFSQFFVGITYSFGQLLFILGLCIHPISNYRKVGQ